MIRAFQWDLARQVERLDWLLAQLPRYGDWGYNELYLHLEDAVEYPSMPGLARSDAYSYRDFERLVAGADRAGIRVVPIVNLLGHTQYLIKDPRFRDLNELRAPDGSPLERGQICPLHPRTLEVAASLLHDMAPFCTAGKVHVGLDESFQLGKHPLSQNEISQIGLAGHFAAHAGRLHTLVAKHGLRMGLWADMLALLPAAIPLLPRGVIAYDWYYYPFGRHPRMELYNFSEYDLSGALNKQGIEYWGCPMNGAFRFEPLPLFADRLGNIRSWWNRCQRTGAAGFLVSSWEAYRLAIEMTTVVDAAAACLWTDPVIDNHTDMLAKGFERVFGKSGAREAARAALRCDERAFAGYARWEINDRWDGCAQPESAAPFAAESRFFGRLCKQRLPEPFAASVAFRHYLAERDVFVRSAVRGVYSIRRVLRRGLLAPAATTRIAELQAEASAFYAAIARGRGAALRMWRRSRDPGQRGQNEAILDRDEQRLRDWLRWLSQCRLNPDLAWEGTPVCGRWQLNFTVHNHAPALQKIIVEQQQADGTWRELAARFTIEFRATAARPRSRIKRGFSVPVENPALPARIAVRGLGRVSISQVSLTNGVDILRPAGRPLSRKSILGKAAPKSGLPTLNWTHNAGELALRFRSG
ncbi:MAG TPA: family 20 glycosylhydrolase [Opitutaceae bacterium]